MMTKIWKMMAFTLLLSLQSLCLFAEDHRTKYPSFLSNSYLDLNFGYINFPFSDLQLQSGYTAESINVRHAGIRLTFGHDFNKCLSAQISYMKPLNQPGYENLNNDRLRHSVWMHAGTLTLKSTFAVNKKLSIYGEGGLAVVTRRGFEIGDFSVVENASYGSFLIGGGAQYQLDSHWDLILGTAYSPANQSVEQPYTVFFSGGLAFHLRPLSTSQVAEDTRFIFPENVVHFGYTTNAFGYGINDFVSKKPVDIFWSGKVEVSHGFWIRYQRNVFHTRKWFSLDGGTSFGYWQSKNDADDFCTLSAFPVFRFTLIRSKAADFYFHYSIAGPSYISRITIDGKDTGKHFTFQDFMGIGMLVGKSRNMTAEVNINHYSNGNLFPDNAAVKVPLTFSLGYTF